MRKRGHGVSCVASLSSDSLPRSPSPLILKEFYTTAWGGSCAYRLSIPMRYVMAPFHIVNGLVRHSHTPIAKPLDVLLARYEQYNKPRKARCKDGSDRAHPR